MLFIGKPKGRSIMIFNRTLFGEENILFVFVFLGFEDPSNHWNKRITNIGLAT